MIASPPSWPSSPHRHHGHHRLIATMAIIASSPPWPSSPHHHRVSGIAGPVGHGPLRDAHCPVATLRGNGERPRRGPPLAARSGGVGKAREEIHVVPCAQLTCLTSLTSHAAREPAVHPNALQRWALGPTNQPNVGGLVKGPVHVVPCAPLAAPASVGLMGGIRVPRW